MHSSERGLSISLFFFNPSVSLWLDVSPIFSHENTGAKMVTLSASASGGRDEGVSPSMNNPHRAKAKLGECEVTFSAPASGSEIGEVPAGGRG